MQEINKRWIALYVLCLGALMIVLDTTIINVALPSIRTALGFSEVSLAWVVNAYMLTFGGFLLLGGRLGDLYGNRKLFLGGLVLFTLASVVCGVAPTKLVLIAARAVQGLGGAVVAAVALTLIMNLFQEPAERAKAMGVYGFVASGGGALGVFLGGLITSTLSWHWVFLVNVPVGIVVFLLVLFLIEPAQKGSENRSLDVAGAVLITSSLMAAVYAIVNGTTSGWGSLQTLGLLLGAALLFFGFIWQESRARAPMVPLRFFRLRTMTTASMVGILWSAAMFAWFFLSALYMQLVLGYSPLQVGLAFLPGNLLMAAFSLGLSARIVTRFGSRGPLTLGMGLIALSLLLFARAPESGTYLLNILPGMILLGLGGGIAFNPVLLLGMRDVPQEESGLASGVLNTAFMMGGALGLAILASLAGFFTKSALESGAAQAAALVSGYHAAFIAGAASAALAAVLSWFLFRESKAAAA
jgi:EmrB/QacA subfamily drug resistance transporter